MTRAVHIPVLFNETITGLALRPGMTVVDATFGGGGHARAIAEAIGKDGRLVAFDADADAFRRVDVNTFPSKVIPVVDNFRNLGKVLDEKGITSIDAFLFDLGLSSFSLESSGRGFSFQRDEPLLMTFSETPGEVTAETVVNDWSEETLADIIYGFGEDRFSRRIARAIVTAREEKRLTSTKALADVISAVVKPGAKGRHPATRTFQAIRMAVNDEFGAIKEGLRSAVERSSAGGRIAVISFHSGEDRIVKNLFKEFSTEGIARIITKKPIVPTRTEQKENPRARSAKLRIVEHQS
jgi:16S rRNA (cytosine1402-N4)-methyltransferase